MVWEKEPFRPITQITKIDTNTLILHTKTSWRFIQNHSKRSLQNSLSASTETALPLAPPPLTCTHEIHFNLCPYITVSVQCSFFVNSVANFTASERMSRNRSWTSEGVAMVGWGSVCTAGPRIRFNKLLAVETPLPPLFPSYILVAIRNCGSLNREKNRK